MTKQKRNDNKVVNEDVDTVSEAQPLTADNVLDQSKGQFTNVIVIGVRRDNGKLDIGTDVPQYPFLQWMISKAAFELHLHERQLADKE